MNSYMRRDLTSSHTSKQARAYALLRHRILSGAYGPGYRLVIDALAREFQSSPTPGRGAQSVKEHSALIELMAAGAPEGCIQQAAQQHKLSAVRCFQEWQAHQGAGSTTEEGGSE